MHKVRCASYRCPRCTCPVASDKESEVVHEDGFLYRPPPADFTLCLHCKLPLYGLAVESIGCELCDPELAESMEEYYADLYDEYHNDYEADVDEYDNPKEV